MVGQYLLTVTKKSNGRNYLLTILTIVTLIINVPAVVLPFLSECIANIATIGNKNIYGFDMVRTVSTTVNIYAS